MGYKITLKPSAKKELAKLDRTNQQRIAAFIDALKECDDPRADGIAMQGTERAWRYRVGNYRIIAEIEDQTVSIHVFKIGHRREVYK